MEISRRRTAWTRSCWSTPDPDAGGAARTRPFYDMVDASGGQGNGGRVPAANWETPRQADAGHWWRQPNIYEKDLPAAQQIEGGTKKVRPGEEAARRLTGQGPAALSLASPSARPASTHFGRGAEREREVRGAGGGGANSARKCPHLIIFPRSKSSKTNLSVSPAPHTSLLASLLARRRTAVTVPASKEVSPVSRGTSRPSTADRLPYLPHSPFHLFSYDLDQDSQDPQVTQVSPPAPAPAPAPVLGPSPGYARVQGEAPGDATEATSP
ncbi:hypothetical protein CRUP_033761, partial [Coryphaenoides rupestris]